MNNQNFYNHEEWLVAVKTNEYDIGFWGNCGSQSAHDINGKLIGEWYSVHDTYDKKAKGWLMVEST